MARGVGQGKGSDPPNLLAEQSDEAEWNVSTRRHGETEIEHRDSLFVFDLRVPLRVSVPPW
jgi:hypothetical protein